MKKFEEYNIKYKHLERTDAYEAPYIQDFAKTFVRWTAMVTQYPQALVQHAVYEAEDHEEWQKFRCSLKGQSTQMKLARLYLYRQKCFADALTSQDRERAQIRVDNYIGALVRGGQLNAAHEVVR